MANDHMHLDQSRGPAPEQGGGPQHTDQAAQSMANALRGSFRLLSVIMIFVLAAFIFSGVESIDPTERGLKRVFGRIVGTVEPGLAFTWPFPIGEIQTISTKEETVRIDDFWFFVSISEATKDLLSRSPSTAGGLRTGLDGALLTGDRSLLHFRISCTYRVENVEKFTMHAADPAEMVRFVVCQEAIQAGGFRTALSLQTGGSTRMRFAEEVRKGAEQRLKKLNCGIAILRIKILEVTWPVKALQTYKQATMAASNAKQLEDQAKGDAEKVLKEVAGMSYGRLVGQSWLRVETVGDGLSSISPDAPIAEENLIGQYELAREEADRADQAGDTELAQKYIERAERILTEIDEVLISNQTGGEVSSIIAAASTKSRQIRDMEKARERRFKILLEKYLETPQLLLSRQWDQTVREIMPRTEKYFLGANNDVLLIGRDPRFDKQADKDKQESSSR